MKVIITIDLPEGSVVNTSAVTHPSWPIGTEEPVYTPAFEDELIPLPPDAIPIKGDIVNELAAAQVTPFRGAATVQPAVNPAFCPIHNQRWKSVPAGVSKKTGKPYAAFMACPERGCDQRPSAA